ncbi:MAG TPA: TonB family protein [Acidisarcina sp.]|nr:TonB family protein [Acidisarcina sp.]
MAEIAEREDALDRKEAYGVPLLRSAFLHLMIAAAFLGIGLLEGLFHHNTWGDANAGGAISATLVSSAPSLPLPQDHPPSENVLATETPSPSPAPPQPKAEEKVEEKAIPIATKQEKAKPAPEKSKSTEKAKTPPKPVPPGKQPPPKQENRAQYGEGTPSHMARSTAGSSGAGGNPVSAAGDFGSRFGWYVAIIQRKVRDSWYTPEVDPHTAEGREAIVTFTLSRDGSPSNVRIATSSGSATLDSSALRAVQRVDTFGPLPPGYNGSSLTVAYTFTYMHPNH